MTALLRSPDPVRRPPRSRVQPKPVEVVPAEPREIEIPAVGKAPRERRHPRPHFPHLIRPRPIRAVPTAGPVEAGSSR